MMYSGSIVQSVIMEHITGKSKNLYDVKRCLMTIPREQITSKEDFVADFITKKKNNVVFQPIFNLKTGEVYSYEALTRIPDSSPLKSVSELFDIARKLKLTAELERLCRDRSIERAKQLSLSKLLSLNVCPSLLNLVKDGHFETLPMLENLLPLRGSIILELTERGLIHNFKTLKKAVDHCKHQGFKIAIDDLGCGSAGLKMLAELEPHIVKIDRFLIKEIHQSTKKQMLLEALLSFCHNINALVVAEGIETAEELQAVIDIKVDMGQGFLLAEPVDEPESHYPEVEFMITKDSENHKQLNNSTSNLLGSLCVYTEPINDNETVLSLIERFNDESITSVTVVNNNMPVGFIDRSKFFSKLGQKFGYALFSKRQVRSVMDSVMAFESSTPIEDVSIKLLSRNKKNIYDDIIVTKNGVYVGIVKIYYILNLLTDQKIRMAIQANPLTGLPGNNLIKEEIIKRLERNEIFAVCYFDLDNFKPYNDVYGFNKGDEVIRFIGNLLKEHTLRYDPRALIGHIGGDDFVVICRATEVKEYCKNIISCFETATSQFHDERDIKAGFYRSNDRKGNPIHYPLLSISIGVVSTQQRKFESYGHIASVASEVKQKAKKISGSCFLIDQRQS